MATLFKTSQIICQTSHLSKSSSIHTSSIGGLCSRFNNSRKGLRNKKYSSSSTILLEKFVKQTDINGAAFVYRAPYNLKIRASYFDEDNEVDAHTNRQMTEQFIRDQQEDIEDISEEEELKQYDINTFKKPPEEQIESNNDSKDDQPNKEQKDGGGLVNIKDSELKEQITSSNTKIIEKIENKNLNDDESDIEDEEERLIFSPLHMLLYGKRSYYTSTYSTVTPKNGQEQSYVVLSDYLEVNNHEIIVG